MGSLRPDSSSVLKGQEALTLMHGGRERMRNPMDSIPQYTRAILKVHLASMGYDRSDFDEKPVIGVVNSWNEVCPGHYPLRELAEHVKNGVREAGGFPLEFNTIALCDAFGQGNAGMRYMLPSRDIIADSIETMVRGGMLFSGLVFLTACDKITPAMLMAAARLDLPSIFVSCGPMNHLGPASVKEKARKEFRGGDIDEEDLIKGNLAFYSGPGVCPFLGTANTMLAVAEALGLMLPGTALIPSGTAARLWASRLAGRRVVQLVKEDMRPRRILSHGAFMNAIRLVMAIGGSLNTLVHIPAISGELGLDVTWDDFDRLSEDTPFLTPITPNGPFSAKDLGLAGGVPAVMKEIASLLDLEAINISGQTLREMVEEAQNTDPEVIHSVSKPVLPYGGITVLKGNIALEGGVVKKSAVPRELWSFRGPARVFDCEEDCTEAITRGDVKDGDVLVIRYEGPQGGPGMREMHRVTELVKGRRLAVITDGRFSGASGGLSVGYITPEALTGGAIACVENGDMIEIDIAERRIELLLDDKTLEERERKLVHPSYSKLTKVLADYQQRVGPASKGARTC
jgi:dihydroxy-acid dehydratase